MRKRLRKWIKKMQLRSVAHILDEQDQKIKIAAHSLEDQERKLRLIAESEYTTRILVKRSNHSPINVLFVCHEPALWSMFESIYNTMLSDHEFAPLIVTLPYKHDSLSTGEFKDAKMSAYLKGKGITHTEGYNPEKNKWVTPSSLRPDYVFYQTPYSFFPTEWSAEQISLIARICYVPYATCIFKGVVDEILHPESFYRIAHFEFLESPFTKKLFAEKFQKSTWYVDERTVVSGHPKLDYLAAAANPNGTIWKKGLDENVKRILWTPRWRTEEGVCHFFDYKDFFIKFCSGNPKIDFAFRPHPLCFQNFLNNGELTEEELLKFEADYASSRNMVIDQSSGYQDTFLSSDILISDTSSMMLEYFATGKPVVYTRRLDQFNELGKELSKGMYQVNNEVELHQVLQMLLSGEDPLRATREELRESLLMLPQEGASEIIKNCIRSDFTL